MTRIEVEELLDPEQLQRRRWVFYVIGTTLRLKTYVVEWRSTRRHKWRPQNAYNRLSLEMMDCPRIKLEAVPLPVWVVRDATKQLSEMIVVKKDWS